MASSCVSCRLSGLLVLAAVVVVLATEEASADDCGQSAICRERTEKLRVLQAERHDLQRRLDDAENTQCEPQVTAAKPVDLGQGEADVGGDVSEIVSAMGPACTALDCPVEGYKNAGPFFSNQLSLRIGQKMAGSENLDKVIETMENLVEADGMVSTLNGGLQFQMNFETNVGNTFRVTGCNSPTGTTCSEGKNCAVEVTTGLQVCPSQHNSQVSECSKCVHGNGLLAQSVQLLTDIPACRTWFVKADAAIRSMTTHMRTFWLTDRINLCTPTSAPTSAPTSPRRRRRRGGGWRL